MDDCEQIGSKLNELKVLLLNITNIQRRQIKQLFWKVKKLENEIIQLKMQFEELEFEEEQAGKEVKTEPTGCVVKQENLEA